MIIHGSCVKEPQLIRGSQLLTLFVVNRIDESIHFLNVIYDGALGAGGLIDEY